MYKKEVLTFLNKNEYMNEYAFLFISLIINNFIKEKLVFVFYNNSIVLLVREKNLICRHA